MTTNQPDWADELAADLLPHYDAYHGIIAGCTCPCISRPNVAHALRQETIAAERRGYERGVEGVCGVVCKMCAEGIYEVGRCKNHWHHYNASPAADAEEDERCIVGDCEASAIRRALAAKEPEE